MYWLIYDARQLSPDLRWAFAVLLIAVGGLAFWWFGKRDAERWARMSAGEGRAGPGPGSGLADPLRRARMQQRIGERVAVAAAALALLVGWMEVAAHVRFTSALDRGEYTLVEGTVFDLERGDRGGHRDEVFSVRSEGRVHTYRYSHSRAERGFHESHGPIREGLRVRIADVDGAIARLEIVR